MQNDGYNKCTGHKIVHPKLPVDVLLTGVQHLKLYSITRNNLKGNLTIFHKSSSESS